MPITIAITAIPAVRCPAKAIASAIVASIGIGASTIVNPS